jgi:DNA-binding NarL/FixJ family response regulator
VLFVTAHDDAKAREDALAGPCAGYFRKTDSRKDLVEAIRCAV